MLADTKWHPETRMSSHVAQVHGHNGEGERGGLEEHVEDIQQNFNKGIKEQMITCC